METQVIKETKRLVDDLKLQINYLEKDLKNIDYNQAKIFMDFNNILKKARGKFSEIVEFEIKDIKNNIENDVKKATKELNKSVDDFKKTFNRITYLQIAFFVAIGLILGFYAGFSINVSVAPNNQSQIILNHVQKAKYMEDGKLLVKFNN